MAKTFTRIGKDIVMAIKDGGPNPDSNSRLRAVMQNAKAANMPKENVERAIKKATDKDTANYKEVLFEGYAPHGIALLLETATDKICGVYIITDNELVKWPKKKKDKTKTEFIKHLLDDAAVGTKGTPVYRPLKNLLKAWKTIPINVIVALNPEALASRRVYETILS